MSIQRHSLDTGSWETRIGEQVRVLRLGGGHDQLQLAELAGVSIGAVQNLEHGKGSTLRTLIRVARALDREDWLDGLSPAATISPIDVMRSGQTVRTRVYRSRPARS